MKNVELNGKVLLMSFLKGLASIIMLYMVYLNQCNKLPITFVVVVILYILLMLIFDLLFKFKSFYQYLFATLDSVFFYFLVILLVWFIDCAILEIGNKFVMPVLIAYSAVSLPIIIISNVATGLLSIKLNHK